MADEPRLTDHEEIEFKASVIGDAPSATLDEIAQLADIDGFTLSSPSQHEIHDLYWDTPDRRLHDRRLSLRLRTVDGQLLFTVKASGGSTAGLFRRQELERAATQAELDGVRAALERAGVPIPRPARTGDTPREWLASAGLIVTQDRRTQRTTRHALVNGEPVAELALDRTRYRFGDRHAEYFEVEVEQLADGELYARDLGAALLNAFPGRLEPAQVGKYSRGLEIERKLADQQAP